MREATREGDARTRSGGQGVFVTTQWSMVTAAGEDSDQALAALEILCGKYWPPLYSYVRRKGHSPEDSEELTQEFFLRLLQKGSLAGANPARGRFRTFLLSSLQHFLISNWRRGQTLRRGGLEGMNFDSSQAEELYLREGATELTPETAYEKKWAAHLLQNVLNRFRSEAESAGKLELFGELNGFAWGDKGEESYSQLSLRLGMSEGALRIAVHRLRQRCRELLREEIAQTVCSPEEVEEEIRYLFRVLT